MQFSQLFILLHNSCDNSVTHKHTSNEWASCRRKRQRQMPDLATVWVRPYYEHLDGNAHTSIGTYHIETTMLSTLKLAVVALFSANVQNHEEQVFFYWLLHTHTPLTSHTHFDAFTIYLLPSLGGFLWTYSPCPACQCVWARGRHFYPLCIHF